MKKAKKKKKDLIERNNLTEAKDFWLVEIYAEN